MLGMITQRHQSFSEALEDLKGSLTVAREGWNREGMFLEIQTPDKFSKMTHPYLVMCIPEGENDGGMRRLPWQPSQVDLFTDDWVTFG